MGSGTKETGDGDIEKLSPKRGREEATGRFPQEEKHAPMHKGPSPGIAPQPSVAQSWWEALKPPSVLESCLVPASQTSSLAFHP